MKIYQTNEIKNIALIGGAKSGKTTLAECIAFESGQINRRGTVEDKNTISDFRDIELERQSSVFSTVMHSEFDGIKINIIDTPGIDDFNGEVVASFKVVETAIMVMNAQNGVEVGTEINWRLASRYNKPLIFLVNQLDHEKANFDETIREAKHLFGEKITVVQYPVSTGAGFNSVIDVMLMKMLKYPATGGKPEVVDIPESEKEKATEYHNILVENAAENEESLMEKFFEEGSLPEEDIIKGVKLGLASRSMFPVYCASTKHNIGPRKLLEIIKSIVPGPDEVEPVKTTEGNEIPCKSSGPVSMLVFKTTIEQHLGEISFFKVYSGEVTESMDVINANNSSKERMTQLFVMSGKNRVKVEKLVAGDFGATIKLKDCQTNHTLNGKGADFKLEPIVFLDPKFRIAISAKNNADDEKLSEVLSQIKKEDPTLLVEYSKELKQIILQGQGELHLNVVKWRIENIFKIPTEFITPKIPYRETIQRSAKAMYRHKKQSGGAGQFGEVHIMIEPYYEGMPDQTEFPIRNKEEKIMPWGGKLVFNNCIVGGAIDQRFLPAILKGIMEKMEVGPLTGCYARDIVVSVYDGKMHPVDSNEISFKIAGMYSFKEAFKNADPKILEPIYDLEVIAPEDKMGDVMTDLQSRRAMIEGISGEGTYQKVKAKIPLAELDKYSTTLSSLTNGRASHSLRFFDYAKVPADIQQKLLKEYEASHKDEE
ncbi:MAG: elongation factor G [Bacteroidota bacterium]|nr:elongation factor G [Bacteroidota bacterium]